MTRILADTYALVGWADGAKPYRNLMIDAGTVTTALNVAEFAYILMRRGQAGALDRLLPAVADRVVEVPAGVPLGAAKFKHDRLAAGTRCSFVDAWGYATAQSLGIPFLTGDDDFRGVPGVKFVKA